MKQWHLGGKVPWGSRGVSAHLLIFSLQTHCGDSFPTWSRTKVQSNWKIHARFQRDAKMDLNLILIIRTKLPTDRPQYPTVGSASMQLSQTHVKTWYLGKNGWDKLQSCGLKPHSNIVGQKSVMLRSGRVMWSWGWELTWAFLLCLWPRFRVCSSCHISWLPSLRCALINHTFHDSYCLIAFQMDYFWWQPYEGRFVGLRNILNTMLQSYSRKKTDLLKTPEADRWWLSVPRNGACLYFQLNDH